MRTITNTNCKLYHTPYCDLLNMQSCQSCMVNSAEDGESVLDDMRVLQEHMPEEGVHGLFMGNECVLCKQEPRGERAYYGLLDLGHPEPKRKKRSVIGLKVDCKVGSMLPIQLGTCKKCRKRILMLEYLPVLLPLGTGLLTLLVLILPGVQEGMMYLGGAILPPALFTVLVLLALVAAGLLKHMLTKKYAALTALDPFEIPLLARMRENGWFPLSVSGNAVRIVFTKKRMQAGVGTGTPEDAVS